VVSTYAGVTLDVIGSAALGVEFKNLDTPTPFHECYERVFDPTPMGQILIAINLFVPIRWIPLRENIIFKSDNAEIHRMTLEIVRDRIRELTDKNGKLLETNRKDILTFLIQETIGAGKRMTDVEYRDHVSPHPHPPLPVSRPPAQRMSYRADILDGQDAQHDGGWPRNYSKCITVVYLRHDEIPGNPDQAAK